MRKIAIRLLIVDRITPRSRKKADTVLKMLDKVGGIMSLEAIKIVVAAETDADKQRAEALAEAKRIIAQAEAKGKDDLQKARGLAEANVQTLCREAEDRGGESTAKAAVETRAQCQALEEKAGTRLEQAVNIIVERVVGVR